MVISGKIYRRIQAIFSAGTRGNFARDEKLKMARMGNIAFLLDKMRIYLLVPEVK
jgi:hypothetical protein